MSVDDAHWEEFVESKYSKNIPPKQSILNSVMVWPHHFQYAFIHPPFCDLLTPWISSDEKVYSEPYNVDLTTKLVPQGLKQSFNFDF